MVLAVAAHFILQMLSPAPWVNLAPLLLAVAAISLLPERPVAGDRHGLNAAIVAIACFLASYALSLILSTNRSASLEVLLALLPGPLLFALLLQLNDASMHSRQLALALNSSALVGSGYLLVVLLAFSAFTPVRVLSGYYSAAFVVPNDVLFLVCLSPFSLHLLLQEHRLGIRLFAAAGLLAMVVTVVLAESRAGLLVFGAVLSGYALTRSWRLLLPGIVTLAAVLLAVDGLRGFAFLQDITSLQSLTYRSVLWRAGIESFLQHPLAGHGPGTFAVIYENLLESGNQPADFDHDTRKIAWAHSLYIEALAERGILGLASLAGLFGVALWLNLRNLREAGWQWADWQIPVLVSLCALLLAGAIDLTFMRTWVMSLSFLLMGLCVIRPPTVDNGSGTLSS